MLLGFHFIDWWLYVVNQVGTFAGVYILFVEFAQPFSLLDYVNGNPTLISQFFFYFLLLDL